MPYPWTETRLTQTAAVAAEHGCASAVDVESLVVECRRLNVLVDTLSRALARYQDEEDEVGGDDPDDHPYQRRGSWSADDWCAVEDCTSKASAHP
jgi:hypothetical protein